MSVRVPQNPSSAGIKAVNKPTNQTPTMLNETIRIQEQLITHYENRQRDHARTADNLIANVTAAEQKLAEEYEYVASIPDRIARARQQIALANQQLQNVEVKPALNKLVRMQERMQQMLAGLSPQEKAEMIRIAGTAV